MDPKPEYGQVHFRLPLLGTIFERKLKSYGRFLGKRIFELGTIFERKLSQDRLLAMGARRAGVSS